MSSSPEPGAARCPLPGESAEAAETAEASQKHSYGRILKSSATLGGSSALIIAIGILRTKAMALFLGPAGFGLLGLYGSIADLSQSIAGMGVNSSGVRQIAEAVGSGDEERIARTAAVLRRTSLFLGIAAAVTLVLLSRQISTLTFGAGHHAAAVALLSLAVFFRLVSAGQGALLQGMRRISDLAKTGVLGALLGTLVSVPVVFFFREKGVAPSLVGVAAMTVAASWWYSRNVRLPSPAMTSSQVKTETVSLLRLGLAFMASGFLTMGASYAVRALVLRSAGGDAVGHYHAAWTLGGLYVGFILQALGADFYPRLTAAARNNALCNRLVNEQALVSLLLAGPGVLATLTFAPLVVALFYSAEFGAAVELLRWLCLGMALRVITWPMGFIILAKGASRFYVWTELAWTVVNVGLSWVCLSAFGLNGAGIAFFGSYVFHGLMLYPVVRRLSGFRWSGPNRKTGLLFLLSVGAVFTGFFLLPPPAAAAAGAAAALLGSAYSLRTLLALVPAEKVPGPLQRVVARLRRA